MRPDRKILLLIAPFAITTVFAAGPDSRWNDAEQRYNQKYGRSYPSTERQQMDAANRNRKKSDQKATAQEKKDTRQQDSERSRSRNGA